MTGSHLLRSLALALTLAAASAIPVSAQTLGFADAVKILAQSCGKDIERHCKTATLANWGITTCLDQHRAEVSAQCTGDLLRVRQAVQARLDAQAAVSKICNGDARQFCQQAQRKRGYTLQCLLKSQRVVSKRCNEAITAAGWR